MISSYVFPCLLLDSTCVSALHYVLLCAAHLDAFPSAGERVRASSHFGPERVNPLALDPVIVWRSVSPFASTAKTSPWPANGCVFGFRELLMIRLRFYDFLIARTCFYALCPPEPVNREFPLFCWSLSFDPIFVCLTSCRDGLFPSIILLLSHK